MRHRLPVLGVLALMLVACGDDDGGVPPDGSPADAGPVDAAPQPDAASPDSGVPGACGPGATFEDGRTPTTVIHVSPTGSDDTGVGSEGAPYATIERAAQGALAGTAIRVHAGTYAGDQYLDGLAGTEAAPIWIGGAPGEARPVLQGGGEALHLTRPAWVILHDLEVTGSSANGINVDDGGDYADPLAAHHVIFRGLHVHDVGAGGNEDCLKLSGLNDFVVRDSAFARCGGGGSGSGVDHVGCHRGIIERCDFNELSGNAVQAKGGSEDLVIQWNTMVDAGERSVNLGGSTGLEYFRPPLDPGAPNAEARRIHVVANVIVGSWSPVAYVGCVDCAVVNNTFIDPGHWTIRILQETVTGSGFEFEPCANGVFANNVVWFERAVVATDVNVGPDTAPDTFTFQNNLWYAHDDPGASAPGLPVAETGAVIGQDPGFTNGYAIGAGSPAAGAGTGSALVAGDLNGTCYADPRSLGAFESP